MINVIVHRSGAERTEKCNYAFPLRGQKCIKTASTQPLCKAFLFSVLSTENKIMYLGALCVFAVNMSLLFCLMTEQLNYC